MKTFGFTIAERKARMLRHLIPERFFWNTGFYKRTSLMYMILRVPDEYPEELVVNALKEADQFDRKVK